MSAPPTRRLGSMAAPAVGYGAMVLSGTYQPAGDDRHGLAALRAAVDAGAGFVDTSDSYGRDGHNERLVGRAIAGRRRGEVQVATKFGLRPPKGEPRRQVPVDYAVGSFPVNAEPRLVRPYLEASLRRLGTDHVDLYYPHFPDPGVPVEDTVGAMAELVAAGLVRHVGLSNVDADLLRRAAAVHPIAAVQVEWSLWHPVDADLRAACTEVGAGIVAYSPVGRGFLAGGATEIGQSDFRRHIDRFAPANLAANRERFAPLRSLAAELGVTPSQLALAWLLHQDPAVVPIPGSRDPDHIRENVASSHIRLDPATLARIDDERRRFAPAGRVS